MEIRVEVIQSDLVCFGLGVVLRNPSGLTAPGRPPVTYERMHSGRLPVQQMDEDTLDALPVKRRYRWRDMFLTVWAMGTYIIDFITDWSVIEIW